VDLHLYIFDLLGHRDRARLKVVCHVWNFFASKKLKEIVPTEGLQLWLCGGLGIKRDGSNVLSWRSEIGSIYVVPNLEASIGQSNFDIKLAGLPQYVKEAKNGKPGVFFDYAHTGRLTSDITLRTICSVHSFEFADRIDHKSVHGYDGTLSNFYIFTDMQSIAMHGGAPEEPNNLSSVHAHYFFRNGTIRLNGNPAKLVRECSQWTDEGLEMAILTLRGPVSGLKRIGADRRCHHYCGTISELLVYDKELSAGEVASIENYLKQKYLKLA